MATRKKAAAPKKAATTKRATTTRKTAAKQPEHKPAADFPPMPEDSKEAAAVRHMAKEATLAMNYAAGAGTLADMAPKPAPYPAPPVLRSTAWAGANLVTFTTHCNTYESVYEETRVTIADEEIAVIAFADIAAFTRDLREVFDRYRRS